MDAFVQVLHRHKLCSMQRSMACISLLVRRGHRSSMAWQRIIVWGHDDSLPMLWELHGAAFCLAGWRKDILVSADIKGCTMDTRMLASWSFLPPKPGLGFVQASLPASSSALSPV